jgi:hypothetical protein
MESVYSVLTFSYDLLWLPFSGRFYVSRSEYLLIDLLMAGWSIVWYMYRNLLHGLT